MDEADFFNLVVRMIAAALIIFNLLVSIKAVIVDSSFYWTVNIIGIIAICVLSILYMTVFSKKAKKRRRP